MRQTRKQKNAPGSFVPEAIARANPAARQRRTPGWRYTAADFARSAVLCRRLFGVALHSRGFRGLRPRASKDYTSARTSPCPVFSRMAACAAARRATGTR